MGTSVPLPRVETCTQRVVEASQPCVRETNIPETPFHSFSYRSINLNNILLTSSVEKLGQVAMSFFGYHAGRKGRRFAKSNASDKDLGPT